MGAAESMSCPHPAAHIGGGVCWHLWRGEASEFAHRFTGDALDYDLLCESCAAPASGPAAGELVRVCMDCFESVSARGSWLAGSRAVLSRAPVAERATRLSFSHEMVRLPAELGAPLWDLVPLPGGSESVWLAVTRAGALFALDLGRKKVSLLAELAAAGVEPEGELGLCASPDGQLVAVVEEEGSSGVVVDVASGDIEVMLDRGEPAQNARFPVAFVRLDGRLLLCHATAWNRLELSDPRGGQPLLQRPSEQAGEHQVAYASSGLHASPDGEWLVDNGFSSEGAGLVSAFRVRRWLESNPFEADDGPSKRYLCQRWHYWDGPIAWLDGGTLAVHGYGPSRAALVPAVLLFDVESGEPLSWFPGPIGALCHEPSPVQEGAGERGLLFSLGDGDGVSVWDPATGERLLHDAGFHPLRYHPGARQFLTTNPGGDLFVISRLVGELS
jgi:hypothetical protein